MMLLSPKSLQLILQETCQEGIHSAVLFTREGNVLSSLIQSQDEGTASAAIASHLWDKVSASDSRIETLLLSGDKGWTALARTADQFVLCLLADPDTESGLLHARLLSTVALLEEPLRSVTLQGIAPSSNL
ncbi:uncharacterized protein [Lepeophtheirus salmonis]|uniref:Mitogen-activated protein-binding protein-interacting protein n=1 Tax=Lepeophtheirus salmonis TaxID=72036 RepID=C1BTN7_LEPSM|nr:ragulator complex protein LAMTOR2-like isoform X1 [Lepeophtheirus salmonis]XP_040571690.1 ragulator complex protein LAMTOR2-like isoform X2 [Lepeophtheirus salmonis]XP_040571691.1 ragulator complex protein LAMTOR2-like isoform X3 [Lepeophtheirus salmonis]XP_040571692.1 ragulator complex protein LAMTOR2-like isoform X4 [Lepeophtheirus salmonis]XP_040571693.1 ragulator complex protein LAMTOR2-like isoform X5 [Lepeophtheirus salmonis]ACO12390.1 Mitogen-activated protein-binding protein-interac